MANYIYALHDNDADLKKRGAFCIKPSDAPKFNADGYGIFRSVQSFKSEVRKMSNLERIVAYAVDIDDDQKEIQWERIKKIGVEPSIAIETKNGFHLYFNINGVASPSLYTSFVEEYLIPIYNACNGAKDLSRILRVPNFYHCKDPNNKFMVNLVYKANVSYTQDRLFEIFSDIFTKYKKEFLLFRKSELDRHYSFPKGTVNKSASEIAISLGSKQTHGNSFMVCCPAHNDSDPSLHITQSGDKTLFFCFGGCTQEKVLNKLVEMKLW